MSNESTTRAPMWYWLLGAVILLWNLFGVFVFAIMVLMVTGSLDVASDQALAQMTEEQRAQTLVTKEVILATPTWSNIAFGVAVGFGVLGSLALLMRKKIAVPFFTISLIGVLVQNSYNYFLSDATAKMGVGLSPMVILIAILSVPFAIWCGKRSFLV